MADAPALATGSKPPRSARKKRPGKDKKAKK